MSEARQFLENLKSIESARDSSTVMSRLESLFKASWVKRDVERYWPKFLLVEKKGFDALLELHCKDIERAAEAIGWELPKNVVVGALPIGKPEASVYHFESSKLIVVSEAMLLFIYVFSKIAIKCLPIQIVDRSYHYSLDLQQSLDAISNNPSIVKWFEDLLICTLYDSSQGVFASKQQILDPNRLVLASEIACLIERMILSHEFGHIMSFEFDPAIEDIDRIGMHSDQNIGRNWFSEFRADQIGSTLAFQSGLDCGLDDALSAMGIYLGFTMMDILFRSVDVALGELECTSMDHQSHPPFSLRRHFVWRFLADHIQVERVQAEELVSIVESIVEELWRRAKPRVLEEYERGTPLSALWCK